MLRFLFKMNSGSQPTFIQMLMPGESTPSLDVGVYVLATPSETIRVIEAKQKKSTSTESQPQAQETVTPVKKKSRITVKDGLCYVDGARHKLPGEPIMLDGVLFTGTMSSSGEPIPQKKQSSDSVQELMDLVESESGGKKKVEPFDESGFLDDLGSEDCCNIGSDKLTVAVMLGGERYTRKFKSEQVASRQHDAITEYLKVDKTMVKELVSGPATPFVKG